MAEPAESAPRSLRRTEVPDTASARAPQPGDQPNRDLHAHVGVLRRRFVLIAATAAVAVLVALALSLVQPTRYQATTEVLVPPPTPTADIERVSAKWAIDPNRAIQDESRIAVAADVSAQVRQRAGGEVTLTAKPVKDANVIQITATAPTAEGASTAANSAAEIYTAKHNPGLDHGTNPAVVLQPAAVPGSPSQPTTVRNLVLALIAGLALGTMLAYLLDALADGR